MNQFLEQKTNCTDKHKKYMEYYNNDNIYWGLGIENELYLEFNKKKLFSKEFFLSNHKRERYSVNYFSNYKEPFKTEAFNSVDINEEIELPIIINSHSFLYTDSKNNSKKLYTKLCEPNPNFNGKTLDEDILANNKYFKDSINNTWLYDGDTFEFTTLNFYNIKLENVINELSKIKNDFIENLQKYQKDNNLYLEYGKIQFMQQNYPFSVHLTNLSNIAIFNNGTLHYNITLPTVLNNNKMIENKEKFILDHKKAIKIIQYLEPLLICVYNTPDYFSNKSKMFSACSQRCAVSRYIGIGTYNTDTMIPGKILTQPNYNSNIWWYNKYHEGSAYNKLSEVGLDINFNKHYNHGIELRFFDHIIDKNKIYESFEFIIYLMDFVLDSEDILENPQKNIIWNNLVCNVMIYGQTYILSINEINLFNSIFNIKLKENNIVNIYYEIYNFLQSKYTKMQKENNKYYYIPNGTLSKLTLNKKEVFSTVNKKCSCFIL